ncbi:glycoside hydrolase family 16 protein [Serendipita vermifera MAFF 305830]|uniref:Glycoside hydrolase family 16 protein n=1 Tax=Serendipita vermifera MAFF 305830 TaxID=933852 RepID=A0A0C3BBW1_SERVB|nr:glycoside hydrolase family 16 protein [Serendipita vermifera MAFF 305830]
MGPAQQTNTIGAPAYLWDTRDPDLDDALHNPDPKQSAIQDAEWTLWSVRGWANYFTLFVLLFGLIALFAGWPIAAYYSQRQWERNGFNLGGINGTGQVPDLPNLPSRIDKDTPQDVYTRVGFDGETYNLVFSDEFNVDGRTFFPGDDPFWEAVDLHYWPTDDIEWYDPEQVITKDGALVFTMEQVPNHGMNFKSGMVQSWNKFCFTGGYIETAVSLPGTPDAPGFWPGVWTMGNLGRAGYGATTEGMWPYSYDSCDVGTFPNQTDRNGNPASAATGNYNHDGPISYLPGQRLSACTCPGSDHPGPSTSNGRSAPEIDIIEAQIRLSVERGQASQSFQLAPFDDGYNYKNTTPETTIYDSTMTVQNTYKGGVWQQAASALTYVKHENYVGTSGGYGTYGFEYNPSRGNDGYITWSVDGEKTWTVTTASVGPNEISQVSQRLIPEEPMYVIINFGMSPGFQGQDFSKLVFPNVMKVDYVRVYQKAGHEDWSCSPDHHPTQDYIDSHAVAYSNPNLTTWDKAGYTFPRNSLLDGC